ncbi:ATP-binding protein [Ktedonobacter racemifer]|uniref:Transcriptional activator domain protein n=1 Tax=Ktedonobacter racemifer DSM 44963 TaxID=485913 RepID=D6TK91_KTERA|nr:AAA family ATPase [Ktedonobacter racemifer]EFH86191.1 transcriptional activator domain protein [Ktedonobacter racemifer DSM 44963]
MELRVPFPSGTNIERPEPGLLRVAVLGPPEVMHIGNRLTFSLRKAQALLLYLAVEKGLHSRSKLASLLWPDSETNTARSALRNALTLLLNLFDTSPAAASPLLIQQDFIGLNPQAPLELDLDVVQQAWKEALRFSIVPPEPLRASLVAQVQHALSLARGSFLDGFWLRDEAPFDRWVQQQQQQWQMRLYLLCDRLSGWQEATGELAQSQATLTRWLELDPLAEEAYRRLMRVHLAQGDATAALQIYATCQARLAEELQIEPSVDTITLADHIRTTSARRAGNRSVYIANVANQPPGELIAPLIGRSSAFTRLVSCYQQVRQGQPQAVLLTGEAGIGKTRLMSEFVAWARAQGAEVLRGQAFELGGRLPYQSLVDALRPRLEAENAPEDLLDDLWLAELSCLLPELRVRYPDLTSPTQDKLVARLRLCEAVARLLQALSKRVPLVLVLDDLHWLDVASFDLVRYLGHCWKDHGSRVLLLCTIRSDQLELNPMLSTRLADLRHDLPMTYIELQPLSQEETMQLLAAMVVERDQSCVDKSEMHGQPTTELAAGCAPGWEAKLRELGNFLFAQTGGQPLYLLEMLKLFQDRGWLVPQLGVDGTWRLEMAVETTTLIAQKRAGRELVPPFVRAIVLTHLSKLTPPARQLVMACAVLGSRVHAQSLWQAAELGAQEGVEALEEAVKSGLLREEIAGGSRADCLCCYSFSHELMRKVVYTELGAARRQITRRGVSDLSAS